MIDRSGVDCLRDYHEPDNQPQHRCDQNCNTGAGREHPVERGHTAEFRGLQDLNVCHMIEQVAPHLLQIGSLRELYQNEHRLIFMQASEVLRVLECGEDIRRCRKRSNSSSEASHTGAMTSDLKHLADS